LHQWCPNPAIVSGCKNTYTHGRARTHRRKHTHCTWVGWHPVQTARRQHKAGCTPPHTAHISSCVFPTPIASSTCEHVYMWLSVPVCLCVSARVLAARRQTCNSGAPQHAESNRAAVKTQGWRLLRIERLKIPQL